MKFLLSLLVNAINRKYRRGEYTRVLNGIKGLNANQDKYSAYINIHWVCALALSGDPRWATEFDYIVSNNMLDMFNENDRLYLITYVNFMALNKPPEKHASMYVLKASKKTKKYFPMLQDSDGNYLT